MRLRDALAAVGLAALPGVTAAQTIDRSNGEAGAPILQLTTTPRAAALGGALAAAAGVTSIFANPAGAVTDRKSTRLNSSHRTISYAVFCLKKKTTDVAQTSCDD